MEIKELIASGIIEMYCMGIASDEEKKLVESMASKSIAVRDEIVSVNEALQLYVMASEKPPAVSLKNKIIGSILNADKDNLELSFPPRISSASTANEWLQYISDHKISAPSDFDPVYLLDLPGDDKQVTYIAWARKGAVVEESHDTEDEYLLMIQGRCSVTVNGKIGFYQAGDLVFIPKNIVHRAEALSDEPMILVGQRIAA